DGDRRTDGGVAREDMDDAGRKGSDRDARAAHRTILPAVGGGQRAERTYCLGGHGIPLKETRNVPITILENARAEIIAAQVLRRSLAEVGVAVEIERLADRGEKVDDVSNRCLERRSGLAA